MGPQELPDGSTWRPKTRKAQRLVAISPELGALFREEWLRQGRGSGWIFPSPHDPSKPRGDFRRALRSACLAAGLPELHPHALRHIAATAAVFAGASMADLREIFGGSSDRMPAQVYTHTSAERTRAVLMAANPLADASEGPARGTSGERKGRTHSGQ